MDIGDHLWDHQPHPKKADFSRLLELKREHWSIENASITIVVALLPKMPGLGSQMLSFARAHSSQFLCARSFRFLQGL
jgi:hypothetical protein